VTRFVADNTGGEAVVTNNVQIDANFFCVDPALADVKVIGGTYTAEGRAEMEASLGERVRSAGVLCTGYGQKGARLEAQTFYTSGRVATGQPNVITVAQSAPKVRLRE
jgi:hypothetical protein